MGWLSFLNTPDDAGPPTGTPFTLFWYKNPQGKFDRLLRVDWNRSDASGKGGIFAVWHQGVRPRWVVLGASDDLGKSLSLAADDQDVASLDLHGGLFATWAIIPKEYRAGIVRFLREAMKPQVDTHAFGHRTDPEAESIPVVPPK